MHFELFDVDVATATIHDARVGDEGVYTGATVQWRGYGRGDRAWMVERLTSALASWTPDHDPNGRWRLTATLEGGPRYTLERRAPDGEWREQRPLGALSPSERAHVMDELDAILESLQALLIIL
ncbi:MAG: hypothetical protein CMH57_07455 [Myxococcales bacterium]|nr:hypothetical protein [Myxococcales bacterium]